MKKILRNIIPFIIFASFGVSVAYAQTPPQTTIRIPPHPTDGMPNFKPSPLVQPLNLVATPSSPSPNQSVSVEAQTPASDGTRANFIWTVDGVRQSDASGFGKNIFTFTAGGVGSIKHISVRVEPFADLPVTASKDIYTTDLALPWTAKTYTPKWYKGKALAIPNSHIRVAAIPTFILDGTTISPDRLI